MPKVTVLMAVYNGERYLREAIDSILTQTFQDFEFLIINDGSIDCSRQIILSYNDPRIRFVENDRNLGLTGSLNRGLELAAGELIARQDGDDISEPDRLREQVAFLNVNPDVALVGTGYTEIDEMGHEIGEGLLPCDPTTLRWHLLFYCPFVHSSVMLRKSPVIERVGGYNEAFTYAQDLEFWCRIARTFSVANLNQSLLKYRVHSSSMTETYGRKVDDEPIQIHNAYIDCLPGGDRIQKLSHAKHLTQRTGLLFDFPKDFEIEGIGTLSDDILRLHTAFCDYYQINRSDRANLRAKIDRQISQKLIHLGHRYFERDLSAAWMLFAKSCRFNWLLLPKVQVLKLLFKLLVGTHFYWIAKRAIQK
jgi:glycosyltransferase involved in cell wall biosynthesis